MNKSQLIDKIAASTVPTFKAGKSLKDKVNAKKGKKK